MEEDACNFDPEATDNTGGCDYSCYGCTDPLACNYNASAIYNDGTCQYPMFGYDCFGNCINDQDGDEVCDEFEIYGCIDEIACRVYV